MSSYYYKTRALNIPVFNAGPWPVWGLTAYIVNRIFKDMDWVDLSAQIEGASVKDCCRRRYRCPLVLKSIKR